MTEGKGQGEARGAQPLSCLPVSRAHQNRRQEPRRPRAGAPRAWGMAAGWAASTEGHPAASSLTAPLTLSEKSGLLPRRPRAAARAEINTRFLPPTRPHWEQ